MKRETTRKMNSFNKKQAVNFTKGAIMQGVNTGA